MSTLDNKKAIADFKKKHLDASRERWLKIVEAKAKRLPPPKLASLTDALQGKKKPDTEEQEMCKAVKDIYDLAENLEKMQQTFAEIQVPLKPVIQQIEHPIASPADVLKLLAAGLLLRLMAKKKFDEAEKK